MFKIYTTRHYSIAYQTLMAIIVVLTISIISYFFGKILGYKTIAMILLMTVSILAMLFDIIPVLISSIMSALIWNFFFIPPIFTFHIGETEDALMFILYFFVACVNAVLNFKIRKEEKKTRDEEEKVNTIKLYDTLFNSLSHELKTPISTIISSVDTLKENNEKLSAIQQDEILNQLDIAASRLHRQVENLLNMSRLESGTLKLNIEWIDINDLIFSTIEKLHTHAPFETIEYQSDPNLPLCKMDGGVLEQILYNILNNAIIYTPKHTTIKISATVSKDILEIQIVDNGNGIPEEMLPHIFEKFYRLPHSKTGGTGLGLSIVRGFVEAHHGSIQVRNELPNGLAFKIKIPTEVSYLNNLKNE